MRIQVTQFDEVGSTNHELLERAKAGAPEGTCFVADTQLAGRGREGRTWHSNPGSGLYLSLLLRPKIDIRHFPLLTLLCAVAVFDTLVELCGIRPDIKWPNDILVNGKKICGILAETCDTPKGAAVVMGIGINFTTESLPPEIRGAATSLSDESGKEASLDAVLESVLDHIDRRYADFVKTQDPTAVLDEWSARSSYAHGKQVSVRTRQKTFFGETTGLDSYGSLMVRTEYGQVITVTAGDVEAVRPDERYKDEADRGVK